MADPLLAPDKAAAIESCIEALEATAAELRLKLGNARAAQQDLDDGCTLHRRSDLKYIVLDNLRSAQREPMIRGLASLGRLMLTLEEAEDAVPLFP